MSSDLTIQSSLCLLINRGCVQSLATDYNNDVVSSGSGSDEILKSFVRNDEVILTVLSPQVLFHFFSDEGVTKGGFNISYW